MKSKESPRPNWQHVIEYFGDSNNFQYVIPVYQRDYVWEAEDQVKRLLDDFSNLIGNSIEHFIGIVINYNVYLGKGYIDQHFVIDGQQRLTTLFLLIFCLFEKAHKDNDSESIDTLEDCLFVNSKKGRESGYKLVPLMNKNNVFVNILDKIEINNEEKESKLYEAYEYIKDYVEKDLCDYTVGEMVDALGRLILVDIPLEKGDNAQQIFESINALGSPLSASDLIRNFVLMQCPDKDKKEFYDFSWLPFENKFADEDEFEEFFRFFIEAKNENFVNSKKIYSSFRDWFLKEIETVGVKGIISLLSTYADNYNYIYHEDLKKFSENGLWHSIVDFRNIKSTMPAPFVLEITRLYKENKIDTIQYKDIIETVNSFIVRRGIIGMDTSGISRFFCTLLKKVLILCDESYSNIVDATRYCIIDSNKEKGSKFPTDEDITNSLKTLDVYQYPDALHYFFDKYENEHQEVEIYHPTLRCQIEHIMPQDGKKWFEEVGLKEDEYNSYKNRLGNLTLTTKHDNPKMSNNLFEYKSIILKGTAQYLLNVDVYNQSTWGAEQIDSRNELLTKELIRLYPYVNAMNADKYKKIMEEYKQKEKAASGKVKGAFAAKLWKSMNVLIEEDDVFEPKDYGTRNFYDFTFGRPYHIYIDLSDCNESIINIGIWFSDSRNENFNIFKENIERIDTEHNKYECISGDGKKRAKLYTSIKIDNLKKQNLDELCERLFKEVKRLYDVTDSLFVDTKLDVEKAEFYSNLTDKWYITDVDEEGKPCIKEKETNIIPYRCDPSQKDILGDFLIGKGIEPQDNTRSRLKQVIDYELGYSKTKDWIISCNPSYYDIEKAFSELEELNWKQNSPNIEVGAFVYIYVSYPKMAVKYKAVVTKVGLSNKDIDDNKYVIKGDILVASQYMKLKLVKVFDDNLLSYNELKNNGFSSPQGWSKVSIKFSKFLEEKLS